MKIFNYSSKKFENTIYLKQTYKQKKKPIKKT